MFGWRKRQIAEQVAKDNDDVAENTEVEVTKDVFDTSESTYTIGKNRAGNTQLRMKMDYGSLTFTMAPDAVVEMIEQLAVTIRKQYSVEITEIQNDSFQPKHT